MLSVSLFLFMYYLLSEGRASAMRWVATLGSSLAMTEKCNKWVVAWTTNVYSVDKPNEQGERRV